MRRLAYEPLAPIVTMPSFIILIFVRVFIVMLCQYAECCNAEWHYPECLNSEWHYGNVFILTVIMLMLFSEGHFAASFLVMSGITVMLFY